MKYSDLRQMIYEGGLDERLDELALVINHRRNFVRQTAAALNVQKLQPGDDIIISQNCKPKMLAGIRVTYIGRRASKLEVRLLHTYSPKWRQGSTMRIPQTLVGKVIKKENADES